MSIIGAEIDSVYLLIYLPMLYIYLCRNEARDDDIPLFFQEGCRIELLTTIEYSIDNCRGIGV